MVETTAEDDAEGESDTGVTGEQLPALEPATAAAREKPVLSAAAEKKLEAATDIFVEAEGKAEALREIATEREAFEILRRFNIPINYEAAQRKSKAYIARLKRWEKERAANDES